MSNTAKGVICILIGAALGLGLGLGKELFLEPPTPCLIPPEREKFIKIKIEEEHLTADHDPVVVLVDNHDKVIWMSDTIMEFEVANIQHERQADPNAVPNPDDNPFNKNNPFPWKASNGKILSGTAKGEAKGHEYKYTIRATVNGEELVFDPHVRFD